MIISRIARSVGVVIACSFVLAVATSEAVDSKSETSVTAAFEGRPIRLADGWGEATACTSDGLSARCYRTEAEMDDAENLPQGLLAACSTSLRLYRSTSFGGGVLQLTSQYAYINLSAYGFDNDTSSYRVGACSSYFYDASSGGSPLYPGSTSGGASASTMVSGWDNRVSSVYIN